MWLTVSGCMVIGLVSGLSLASHSDSQSFLVVWASLSHREDFWEVGKMYCLFPLVGWHVPHLLSAPPEFSLLIFCSSITFLIDTLLWGDSCKQLSLCLAKAGSFGQQFPDRSLGKGLWYCSWCWKVCESFQRLSRDLGLQASVNISLLKDSVEMEPWKIPRVDGEKITAYSFCFSSSVLSELVTCRSLFLFVFSLKAHVSVSVFVFDSWLKLLHWHLCLLLVHL